MTPVQPVRGTQSLLGEDADRLPRSSRRSTGCAVCTASSGSKCRLSSRPACSREPSARRPTSCRRKCTASRTGAGNSITLRPEFTAGICRAYLSEGWQQHAPLKVATHGSAFRYERPQKGRFREFHQLDAEIIGAAEPQADVEILSLGYQLLQELGIADGVTLELNTLGDPETRDAWRAALVDYFQSHRDALSEDSVARLERNPLRILDSKDPRDKAICRRCTQRRRLSDQRSGRLLRRGHRESRRRGCPLFLPRPGTSADYLRNIHCFNLAGQLSFGMPVGDVPSVVNHQRVVAGIAKDLFVEGVDTATHERFINAPLASPDPRPYLPSVEEPRGREVA